GGFEPNYLHNDFPARGLIDDSGKSSFKDFPFFADASEIVRIQREFFTSFIDTYYASDANVENDYGIKAWFGEVNRGSGLDFCARFPGEETKQNLIHALTQNAWLQVAHHYLNAGGPVRSSLTVPFQPGGLYKPVPTTRNIDDAALVSFFPNATASVTNIAFLTSFNRPRYRSMAQPRTLAYAYSGPEFLARFGEREIKQAADKYLKGMTTLGEKNQARKIEEDGTCTGQGLPFCGSAINPLYMPWFFSV
ncbi:Lipoxygenase, partial [Byssothecium circinans]